MSNELEAKQGGIPNDKLRKAWAQRKWTEAEGHQRVADAVNPATFQAAEQLAVLKDRLVGTNKRAGLGRNPARHGALGRRVRTGIMNKRCEVCVGRFVSPEDYEACGKPWLLRATKEHSRKVAEPAAVRG